MTYWVEIRSFKERVGQPFFVDLAKLGEVKYLGFRSVYAYPDAVKEAIMDAGSSAGLGAAPVYSDTLFLDFDNAEEAASDFLLWLYDEEYAHEAYTSGNRSVHIHVPLEPVEGAWVPYSQRVWVSQQAPKADVSFYTQAGQYRLDGTRHAKTGRRKEMFRQLYGKRLEIPRVDRPDPAHVAAQHEGARFHGQLLAVRGEGGRRIYAWHLARLAHAEGIAFADARTSILWWNSRHCYPPLPESIVDAKLREVYNARAS